MLAESKFIDILNLLLQVFIPVLLIVLGYVVGKIPERRHLNRVKRSEQSPGAACLPVR